MMIEQRKEQSLQEPEYTHDISREECSIVAVII